MDIDPKYTFYPLINMNFNVINDKYTQRLLLKWGLKGNLIIQYFSFNEPFQSYHKYLLADAFFKNDTVIKELLFKQGDLWSKQGIKAFHVEVKNVPCSVLNMSFFDKLKDPKNGIVCASNTICKRYDTTINGFLVSDKLRGMLLDKESEEYNLFSEDERQEFIFRIFQFLVLGGILCQYEDTLDPYLNITKNFYKDLVRVQKQKNTEELYISTLVVEVIARDQRNQAYFPRDPCNKQNIGFLLIDGNRREITTVLHQFGGYFT